MGFSFSEIVFERIQLFILFLISYTETAKTLKVFDTSLLIKAKFKTLVIIIIVFKGHL